MGKEVKLLLEEILARKSMTRYALARKAGIAYPIVDKYYKNKVSRYDKDIILRLCRALDCEPGDIIRLTDDGEEV